MAVPSKLSPLVAEFLLVSSGKILSLGALFVCGIVVARFCGPAEFGRFSAALSIVLLLDAALGGPLDYAAVRFSALHRNEPQRITRFHGTTFRLKIILLLALVPVTFAARRPLTSLLFDRDESPTLLLWCAGAAASLILLRSTFAWLQSCVQFRAYAMMDALNGLCRIGAMIAVGIGGARSAEAFLGVFAAAVIGTYAGSLLLIRQPYLVAGRPERTDVRSIAGYAGATAVVLVLGTFTGRSDIFFVKRLVSSEAAGLYASAAQVATLVTMFASYACLVLQPRLLHAGGASIRRLAWWSAAAGCTAGAILLPASWLGGGRALAAVFGARYEPAGLLLTILLVGSCIDVILMPVLMTYALQARARAAMVGEVGVAAVYTILILTVGVDGPAQIAWIATATRGLKLVLYAVLALRSARLSAPPSPGGPPDPSETATPYREG